MFVNRELSEVNVLKNNFKLEFYNLATEISNLQTECQGKGDV